MNDDRSYEVYFIHPYFSVYVFVLDADDEEHAGEVAAAMLFDENVEEWIVENAQEVSVSKFDQRFVV